MSGVAIRLSFSDLGALGSLKAVQETLGDLRPVLEDIGSELESSTVERFQTNVSPDGVAWPQSLRARESGGRTLVQSTALRDSVNYRVDGSNAVEVGAGGIARDYAAIHQFGGTITAKGKALRFRLASGQFVTVRSVRIPARPYLGLSAADRKAIPEIAQEHMRLALASGRAAP